MTTDNSGAGPKKSAKDDLSAGIGHRYSVAKSELYRRASPTTRYPGRPAQAL